MVSPRKDPLWFKCWMWLGHRPVAVILFILALVMIGFALGRESPIQ